MRLSRTGVVSLSCVLVVVAAVAACTGEEANLTPGQEWDAGESDVDVADDGGEDAAEAGVVPGCVAHGEHPPGTLDPSYSVSRVSLPPAFTVGAAAVDAKDRVVLAGSMRCEDGGGFAAVRVNDVGTKDSTFASGNSQYVACGPIRVGGMTSSTTIAAAVAASPSGAITIGGSALSNDAALLRLTEDGTVDTTIGSEGAVGYPEFGLSALGGLAPAGDKLVVGLNTSSAAFIGRVGPSLMQDVSYVSSNQPDMIVTSVAVGAGGEVTAMGRTIDGKKWRVLKTDGVGGAAAYGVDGGVELDVENDTELRQSLALAGGGVLFVSISRGPGAEPTPLLRRLTSAGTWDSAFAPAALPLHLPNKAFGTAVVQCDGRIVVVGTNDAGLLGLVRLEASGARDATFGEDGVVATNLPYEPRAVFVDSKQRIVVVVSTGEGDGGDGAERFFVVRVLP